MDSGNCDKLISMYTLDFDFFKNVCDLTKIPTNQHYTMNDDD